jgi:hypothetical protein
MWYHGEQIYDMKLTMKKEKIFDMKNIKKVVLDRWSHVVNMDKKGTRDLFSYHNFNYRFMVVSNRKRLLFL